MRICRYNKNSYGLIEGDEVIEVTQAFSILPNAVYPYPRQDLMIERLAELRPEIARVAATGRRFAIGDVAFDSPVANPGKLIGAPVNYGKHLEEVKQQIELHSNNPAHSRKIREIGLFLKATSSLIGPGQPVRLRMPERRNDHEIELAVVIGREATNVRAENALDIIAGYTIGLDMTVRGPEERSLRKSIDTYSVLGPWLVTADEIPDPASLAFELKVNGETRQAANTKDLVLTIPELIEFASHYYTLYPGDVIYTGTPEGVGPVVPGDIIDATFEGIGQMLVRVEAA